MLAVPVSAPGLGGGKRVGIRMRAVTARWVAYVIGAGSIALIIGSVVLAYLDRHASLPAGQQTWGFSYTFGGEHRCPRCGPGPGLPQAR